MKNLTHDNNQCLILRSVLLLNIALVLAATTRYLSNGSLGITELHYCALFSVSQLAIFYLFNFIGPMFQLCCTLFISEVQFQLAHLLSYLLGLVSSLVWDGLEIARKYKNNHNLINHPVLSSLILQAMDTSTAFIPEI